MKKTLKFISLLLTLIMIISLFCGCNALDELRNSVAHTTDSSNIKLGDNIYIRLPYCETLYADFNAGYEDVFVVEEDVPILLSAIVGEPCMLTNNGILLTNEENITYCRSDYYEQANNQIENGFKPHKYSYGYYKITEDDYAGKWIRRTLTNEELKAMKTVLSGEGEVLADNMNVLFDYIVTVEYSSEDNLFYKGLCDVYIYEDSYTLVTNYDEEHKVYNVPTAMNDIFKNMVDEYIENEQLWYE